MEDEDEEAPLAVEISRVPDASRPQDGDVSAGFTVIYGYFGAGNSTVILSVSFGCVFVHETELNLYFFSLSTIL